MLNPKPGERILDIACGNGIFAKYLAEHGVNVTAFDYNPTMIERAKERCTHCAGNITFSVADATDYDQVIALAEV